MTLPEEITTAFSLSNQVAVVTGGGAGIGREISRLMALAGAHVALADIDDEALKETADYISGNRGRVSCHQFDASRREDVEQLADAVKTEAGRLDIWVNCAGVSFLHDILGTIPAQAQSMVAINMMGTYWGCMAAGRVMRDRGRGSIINISSAGGSKPLPGMAIYGMTKAAVNALTWTSATEFGPHGIRVNALAPGFIETEASTKLYRNTAGEIDAHLREEVLSRITAQSPLGRLGTTWDIALAALYLASEAGRYVTGQVIRINGGESM